MKIIDFHHVGLPTNDPKRLVVVRNSPAGFLQAFVLDPDRNLIEINSAA